MSSTVAPPAPAAATDRAAVVIARPRAVRVPAAAVAAAALVAALGACTWLVLAAAQRPSVLSPPTRRLPERWLRARLVEQEASRQAFVATASHELRTPLASLQATLELLREEASGTSADPARLVGRADTALRQTHRLVGLATDLLDLSRVEGDAPLRLEPLEVREVADTVAREFAARLLPEGRELVVEGGPALALADPAALARIIRILLDNASRHGAGTVGVEVGAQADRVVVSVTDEGPGLDPDEREAVFVRFARGRAATSSWRRARPARGSCSRCRPGRAAATALTERQPRLEPGRRSVRHGGPMRMAAAVLGVTCLLATGCAEVSSASRPPEARMASSTTARSCPTVVAGTLAGVAGRIYAQAAGGRNVLSATRRLQRSGALVAAVASGDPAATRRALSPLLEHQIRRIVIRRGPRVLARAGHGAALAPVTGVLRDRAGREVGSFTLSVAGGHVVARAAGRSVGAPARVVVLRGPLLVRIGLPAGALGSCSGSAADIRADTIAVVGRRLLAGEASGPDARRVVRYVAADAGVRRAVARDDPSALRAAIVRLSGVRALHVVRIRATTADGSLVNDVGGPYALAPITGPVRGPDGRRAGQVVVAVQDDAGYVKLAHRFTGAQVVLRGAGGVIPGGTLSAVGAARLPARGTVVVGGRRYRVRSFAGRAFPEGPLWISLLVPAQRNVRPSPR